MVAFWFLVVASALLVTPWKVDASFEYAAQLKHGVTARGYRIRTKASGIADILVMDGNNSALILDVKGLKDFRTVRIQNKAHLPSFSLVIYNASSEERKSNVLLTNVDLNHSILDLPFLLNGDAWLAVTTQNHRVGELVGRLRLQPAGNLPVDVVPLDWASFRQILTLAQSLFKIGSPLGLPAVDVTKLPSVILTQLVSPQTDALTGPGVTDLILIDSLYQDTTWVNATSNLDWITAVDPAAVIAQVLFLPTADVVAANVYNVDLFMQPHYVAVDRPNKRLVVAIRGSVSDSDWATDFIAQTLVIDAERGVGAHFGMYKSAEIILGTISGPLTAALAANPGFGVVFMGHSLGAGVAALAAFMVRNSISSGAQAIAALPGVKDTVSGSCFSTPPVLTMDAAASTMSYVTTVIAGNDVVPRSSIVNLKHLIDTINGGAGSGGKVVGAISPVVYDYSATSVSSSLINGAETVYPMYSPGTLYQLLMIQTPDGVTCSDNAMITAANSEERFKTVYFKYDMISSHSLVDTVIPCLANQLGL